MTSSNKIYARVQGTQIIEYPVTYEEIKARNHPMAWYLPVVITGSSHLEYIGYVLSTEISVDRKAGVVNCIYTQRPMTLDEILASFIVSKQGDVVTAKKVSEIPAGLLNDAFEKISAYAEDQLNSVVKQKYDSIDVLLARYSNSNNEVWRKEAAFIQSALEKLWSDLIEYYANIRAGVVEVPTSIAIVTQAYEIPSWDDLK